MSTISPFTHNFAQNPRLKPVIKVPIIWILGGPGSGKGTQCGKMVAKYNLVHLSTGDLLRREVEIQTEKGKQVQLLMDRGELVPNEIVLELLKTAITKALPKAKGFLIDGYPREKEQGIMFEKIVAPVTSVLFFQTSDETLIARLRNRAQNSIRSDDLNESVMKNRIDMFNAQKDLILEQYSSKLITINAERTVDEVFADVEAHLVPLLV